MTLHLHRKTGTTAHPATAPPEAFNLRATLTWLDQTGSLDTDLVAMVMGVDVNRIIDLALGEDPSAEELSLFVPALTRLRNAAERLKEQKIEGRALNMALWPRIGEFRSGVLPEISPVASTAATTGESFAIEKKSA